MIELDKVYFENCLETLSRMDNDSVDCVITSPPYNMNLRIRNGKYCSRQIVKELSTKYSTFDDNLPIEEYNEFHSNVLSELLRVSKVVFYNIQIVTGSKRSIFKMIGDFNEQLKDIIVWDKGVAQPAMQKQVLNRRTELILVFETDYPISRQYKYANFERGTLNDIWEIKRGKKVSKNHGATFPEELISKILENFTKEGEIVYDPFMGTGTTAIVCKKMNRRFIGSELGKEYYDFILERLSELNNEIQF
ncbi:site-specific DNA-methyltransferase [Flavobacteriaceae bacterium LSUCC0859]|nr:site-specific DNA-methyltransferase [Flavobacteriaceae bacterium LSUCC0859]